MKKEKALKYFIKGNNCSQSVFASIAVNYGLTEQQALDISAPFGGGMGRLQETCGAITGSLMALGLANNNMTPEEIKNKMYSDTRKFHSLFKEMHSSTYCKDIIKVDLLTEEGRNEFKEKDIKMKVCKKCIFDAIDILENHFNV